MGKVRVRAHIESIDDKTLVIRELPYGITTESFIQSVQDAVNKGKFKLASIHDYTAEKVEIELKAPRGVNVQQLMKPLYAFTQCEVSISVNLLVICNNHPVQMTTHEVIAFNTKTFRKDAPSGVVSCFRDSSTTMAAKADGAVFYSGENLSKVGSS